MGKGPELIIERKMINTANWGWMNFPHNKMDLGPRPLADGSDGKWQPMLSKTGQT